MPTVMTSAQLPDYMRARVVLEGECWLWTGAKATNGYGHTNRSRGPVLAHRASYHHMVGPIPEGLQIDHLCRVRLCVNPAHLEAVTGAENMRRYFATITHCAQGHEYSEANTCRSGGRRSCRACNAAKARAYGQANREKRTARQREMRAAGLWRSNEARNEKAAQARG